MENSTEFPLPKIKIIGMKKKSDGNLDPNELDYWQLEKLNNKDLEEKSD